ncbi:MAG: Glucose-1-phosphate adenylyltransferase [Candidatus Anoxychlamydiales bacterium]|nr:Glucose-1-phosphate adenylyltransferase [Candidatus Anoxychlamydiales bacterium]NGX40217.1 Glucose-1-phosphate adenylyltransferase [Candidatus Anoxychlamydiales bacterium]
MLFETTMKHHNIASIILAGGKGTRLHPLTLYHSKPAVSYGGRYRLIDIPISNSLNSNIRQILVIGQYLTTEIGHHLSQTYQFDNFFPGRLDLITPEEKPNGERVFFDGTADAIRKNLDKILELPVDFFLILSGDQLYNIDFQKMFSFAKEKDADLTIASLPVSEQDAKRLGLLKINKDSYIVDFFEKPQEKEILDNFRLDETIDKECKITKEKPFLGSMGIYIFKRNALKTLLLEDPREDFGKHLIPTQLNKGKAASFVYDGYWEDIGTIKSFYDANLALTTSNLGLKIYDEKNPIYTCAHHLPGANIKTTKITNSIICEGSVIEAEEINHSMIGLRTKIKKGTIIKDSVFLGNSTYTSPEQTKDVLPDIFEIGENCRIEKTIIDEHVKIGNNVKLINKENLTSYDSENIYVRDSIIVITAGTILPDNFEF